MGPKIPDMNDILKTWAWITFIRRNAKDDKEAERKTNLTEVTEPSEGEDPTGSQIKEDVRVIKDDDMRVDTKDETDKEGIQVNDRDSMEVGRNTHIKVTETIKVNNIHDGKDKEDIRDKERKADKKDEEVKKDEEDTEEEETDGEQLWFEDYDLVVLWDKVRVVTGEPEYSKEEFIKDPQAQLLYTSSFENNSNLVQHHDFEISEKTTSVVTTKLKKGFIRGDKGIISLPLPSQVAKSTVHFGKEIVINEDGKRTLKTRSWNAKKKIRARPKKKTIVELVVLEKHFKCKFSTKVRLRGTVRVNIMDLKTGKLVEVVQNKISTVLDDVKNVDSSKLPGYNVANKSWTVEGEIEFLYGVEEKTKLWYTDLPTEGEKTKVRENGDNSNFTLVEDGTQCGDIVEDTEDEFVDDLRFANNDDDASSNGHSCDDDGGHADQTNTQSSLERLEDRNHPSSFPPLINDNTCRRSSSSFSRYSPLPEIHSDRK